VIRNLFTGARTNGVKSSHFVRNKSQKEAMGTIGGAKKRKDVTQQIALNGILTKEKEKQQGGTTKNWVQPKTGPIRKTRMGKYKEKKKGIQTLAKGKSMCVFLQWKR